MAPRFGTDGIRGLANEELTAEVALALGRAAVAVLGGDRFLIGSDTRRSGPMLEAALTAGICSAGGDVVSLGVVPTPAVAWASAAEPAPAAMISASHNPWRDNGIKLFAAGGLKLDDDVEAAVEIRYLAELATSGRPQEAGAAERVGGLTRAGVDGWLDLVTGSVSTARPLVGMTLVVDCAHGAAAQLGPEPYRRLGAEVVVIGDQPDGTNINDGVGSTQPEALQAEVARVGADAGLALDGDADRLIAVDERGQVVDGDRVLAILATDWSGAGRLRDDTVVVTVMTNLGFHRAMDRAGIKVLTTAVGDRSVLAALDDQRLSLGGEQSGHIICRDLATTGDGVLTGVQLLDVVARAGRPLSELAEGIMDQVPQILRNVEMAERHDDPVGVLADEIAAVEAELGADGRVLVRPSGTEPLLRIMVEHLDASMAEQACDRLVSAAEAAFGA